jgi:hypothetical protein
MSVIFLPFFCRQAQLCAVILEIELIMSQLKEGRISAVQVLLDGLNVDRHRKIPFSFGFHDLAAGALNWFV